MVRFVLPRDEARNFDFASLQSATGQRWLRQFDKSTAELDTMLVVTGYGGASPQLLTKARAALFIASQLGLPWRLVAAAGILPNAALDPVYDFIARRRYRWFGRSDTCILPKPEHRARVIDV